MPETVYSEIMAGYPEPDAAGAAALLAAELEKSAVKLVVLDDDPTGVQTVHDVSVYTDWSYESVLSGFREENRMFFILTNSRGFTAEQTTRAHLEIAAAAARASRETGVDYMLVSRGDSTLRGHYPLETQLLREETEREMGVRIDGEILCPFFKEGGRFTLGDVHYVRYGDRLVPAAETEFARDATFGYEHSNLCEYIEEKTGGAYKAGDVTCISIDELRALDVDGITNRLCAVRDFGKVVANAADYADVKVLSAAIYRAIARGKRFILRTAASLVKELGGVPDRPLLTRREMVTGDAKMGGVVVVGSHTDKTTRQLAALAQLRDVECLEFNSDLVLDDALFAAETVRVRRALEDIIRSGRTAVAYTKRKLLTVPDDTPEGALVRSVKISDAVQSLVGELEVTPAFVIAKGGITSSDVGTKALGVKRALVMGQIRPGIPVWKTGPESRFPDTPYVIFPGNVGEDSTLRECVEVLTEK